MDYFFRMQEKFDDRKLGKVIKKSWKQFYN